MHWEERKDRNRRRRIVWSNSPIVDFTVTLVVSLELCCCYVMVDMMAAHREIQLKRNTYPCQDSWYTPIILVLGMMKQKDSDVLGQREPQIKT